MISSHGASPINPPRVSPDPDPVTVRVPATTSNLGPGYDCLGVALGLANRVTVQALGLSNEWVYPVHPMATEVAQAFFARTRVPEFPILWSAEGDVPTSRGLGSSVTLRLGLAAGLNRICGDPLDRAGLFALCAGLEGHPDNAAPAVFGGFTVSVDNDTPPLRFGVGPELRFVLLVPDFEVRTADARALLPAEVSRAAAVASAARACRITAAFAARDYAALRGAFVDEAFHEPHRRPLVPFLPAVVAAGEAAGALGGFLSGSGSTVCCLTLENQEAVGAAMLAACGRPGARFLVTTADEAGMTILPG